MNFLNQLNGVLDRQEKAFAMITGQRGGGKVVAQTPSGANILLTGTMETGRKCFYDRRTSNIISEAPDVVFSEFGV